MKDRERTSSWRGPAASLGAAAIGAAACGAVALGAVAVARLAVGDLAVRRARIRRLEITELVVRRTRFGGPAAVRAAQHPNVDLVQRIGQALREGRSATAAGALAEGCVWHYFNPRLPDLTGDYHGPAGLAALLARLADVSGGAFAIQPVSATAFGDELVATHARLRLAQGPAAMDADAATIWRVHGGRIVEVWEIAAADAIQENSHERDRP